MKKQAESDQPRKAQRVGAKPPSPSVALEASFVEIVGLTQQARQRAFQAVNTELIDQLTDGRVLVVEYKGKYIYDTADSAEKRAVGAVWASRSNGRCLFVMPTEGDFSTIVQAMKLP